MENVKKYLSFRAHIRQKNVTLWNKMPVLKLQG